MRRPPAEDRASTEIDPLDERPEQTHPVVVVLAVLVLLACIAGPSLLRGAAERAEARLAAASSYVVRR